jgi:hypothetical protein
VFCVFMAAWNRKDETGSLEPVRTLLREGRATLGADAGGADAVGWATVVAARATNALERMGARLETMARYMVQGCRAKRAARGRPGVQVETADDGRL